MSDRLLFYTTPESHQADSNRQPADYETAALPIAPWGHEADYCGPAVCRRCSSVSLPDDGGIGHPAGSVSVWIAEEGVEPSFQGL